MARPGLTKHRKFARLSRLLGSPALARGSLELLWDVAYENGDDLLGTQEDVEYLASWTGQAGNLTGALVEAGFLDCDGEQYRVHDLLDHAPDYVRKRLKREIERRKNGAELRTLTGRCPDDDRSLSSTPAPAPAPAPEGQRPCDRAKSPARFTAPTVEQVKAYCDERRNGVDPQLWFDHYTANGWKVGKNPMKDWKAAVRTWEKNHGGPRTQRVDGKGTQSGEVKGGKYAGVGVVVNTDARGREPEAVPAGATGRSPVAVSGS